MNRKPSSRTLEWLYAELPALVADGLVTAESAEAIRKRYGAVERRSAASVAVIGLGALGASFIIGGVILLLASNWENLSRGTRAIIAFLPLLIGQALVVYTLLRKQDSTAWREGSGIFLTGSIAACIALIGQTYHLPGDMAAFLGVWLLLASPLIYLLNASMLAAAAMYGALWWAGESHSEWKPYMAGVFIFGLAPHLYFASRANPRGLRFQFLLWCAVPFLFFVPPVFDLWDWDAWAMATYALLISVALLFGISPWAGPSWNPCTLVGGAGTATWAIMFTHAALWDEPDWYDPSNVWTRGDIASVVFMLLLVAATALLLLPHVLRRNTLVLLWGSMGLLVLTARILIYLGAQPASFVLVCHFYTLALAVVTLRAGIQSGGLVLTNMGMGILASYAVLRFVDIDVPFLLKGVLFILIGIAFLSGNIFLARRAKRMEGTQS